MYIFTTLIKDNFLKQDDTAPSFKRGHTEYYMEVGKRSRRDVLKTMFFHHQAEFSAAIRTV